MTAPIQPIPIDLLPVGPRPIDTEEQFDAKSFATIEAQEAMIPQINAATAASYQNAVATDERAVAADASKTAAAASAVAANTQANRSRDEADRSEVAKQAALVAAAAAGAAAGLPTFAGKKGQFLAVKADETGAEWVAGGLEVGGTYVGYRKPQAGVFLDPGAVYLKASYPDLAAILPAVSDGTFVATARTLPASIMWRSVAYGAGLYVAVGTAANNAATTIYATSTDGATWIQRVIPSAPWISVIFAGGKFVAMGSNGVGATSVDGITWVQGVIPTGNFNQITYGNGIYIALNVGGSASSANVYTSPDGSNWTQRTTPVAIIADSVGFGVGIFVTTGRTGASNTGVVLTSSDGITWIQRSTPTNVNRGAVGYGNGTFVVLPSSYGGASEAIVSPDAITWSVVSLPATAGWWRVVYGNGVFVALTINTAGTTIAASSRDGLLWTSRVLGTSVNWQDIVFGNNLFAAVSYGVSSAVGNVANSVKVFQYDAATQFFLPRPLEAFGAANQWVKAA